MRTRLPPVDVARWLFAAAMVAVLFSPPLTSLCELALYVLMIGSADNRARLARALGQPLAAMSMLFWAVVAVAMIYSAAPPGEAWSQFTGWRKLLLVPIGVALFDDAAWKARLALVLVAVTAACALLSILGAAFDVSVSPYGPGIIVRNHATQGMVFAVAAFAAALLAHESLPGSGRRRLLASVAGLLVANLLFVTPGRSGYAVFAVLTVALLLHLLARAQVSAARRGVLAIAGVLVIVAVIGSSPLVRQRLVQGWEEFQSPGDTSMGLRAVYWHNTVDVIAERPWLGHGTGTFEAAYERITSGRPGVYGHPIHDPHNQFMKIIAEQGLVGLLVFLGFLAAALRQRCSAPYRLMGLGVLAAWCVSSLFSSHFSTFAEGRVIALWLGAMLARD
jgi:O-antigen ligase